VVVQKQLDALDQHESAIGNEQRVLNGTINLTIRFKKKAFYY
jgi:hypothetical protein